MRRAVTMAPGGHVIASSAPVTRRRALMAGAPAPPTYVGTRDAATLLGESFTSLTPSSLSGDLAVMVVIAHGASPTVAGPAGWTELDAGVVGRLAYGVYSRVLTGSDSWTVTGSGDGGNVRHWVFSGGSGTADVSSVASSASTHSITVPDPPAGMFRWTVLPCAWTGSVYFKNPGNEDGSGRGQYFGGATSHMSQWNSYPEDSDWQSGDEGSFWTTYSGGVFSDPASASAAAFGISIT